MNLPVHVVGKFLNLIILSISCYSYAYAAIIPILVAELTAERKYHKYPDTMHTEKYTGMF